jgi:hypothetical protein
MEVNLLIDISLEVGPPLNRREAHRATEVTVPDYCVPCDSSKPSLGRLKMLQTGWGYLSRGPKQASGSPQDSI